MNETLQLINNRKSVRKFQNKKINSKNINTIIHSAMRAPTAGNQMLYSILEVEDQTLKDRLVKSCDNQSFISSSPLVLIFLADFQRSYDFFLSSGVLDYGRKAGITHRSPDVGEFMLAGCDALIAAQTSVLAAESIGIGSCYIGDIMENYELHREMFDLPEYTFPVSMLCYGYPEGDYSNRKPAPRYKSEYIHFKNKYRRFNKSDFEDMTQPVKDVYFRSNNYLGNAVNMGQHFYTKKFTADFTLEMNRSVKKAMDIWSALK